VYHLEAPHPPLMTYSFSLSAVMQKKKNQNHGPVSICSKQHMMVFREPILPDKTLPAEYRASSVPEAITFKRSSNLSIN
jgi:hypothetical protein